MTKAKKAPRFAHTSNAKMGMGDHYGRAIHAKMGRMRDMFVPGENPLPPKSIKKPPRTLA